MPKNNTSHLLDQLTLGKNTEYKSSYDPSLLDTVPRSLTRQTLGIDEQHLPFVGVDIWTGYEVSWLNNKGKPQVAIAEFNFQFDSDVLVESKSFKLYLNSFNQSRFENWQQVQSVMTQDLTQASGKPVQVSLFSLDDYTNKGLCRPAQNHSVNLDQLDIDIDIYDYEPNLLKPLDKPLNVSETLVSHLLKSNCLVTGQPDWASVVIEYSGQALDHESVLKYLISFRGHNEFHEHCVERIYVDINNLIKPERLMVYARYTRRGGLDINPLRSSTKINAPFERLVRQ
ncbi:NADPH-dependent 7-cyano-7-deazaguanine reductase QueF [Saccharobesus litoralis]|uniref:NADPH-dependent 7-cyano-7-deazaguanine reductase n=1 Tax=Saccharobesus litoralis TaxID=2172099 RepID=A0A2S0VM01_9ALTE|nr:NADPH-dependent 7-cyano-7-deazaguanine reductase QueF [Saccharobesus litoralis]AWB65241.1 NADPH-dependent 7-cyano-7-deazaguanine reductase QueF [Saccharobesus litoralis]